MEKLTASVGHDAKNQPTDVTLIQKLLNDNKVTGEIRPLKIEKKNYFYGYARWPC